jgi:hypothetical protein
MAPIYWPKQRQEAHYLLDRLIRNQNSDDVRGSIYWASNEIPLGTLSLHETKTETLRFSSADSFDSKSCLAMAQEWMKEVPFNAMIC